VRELSSRVDLGRARLAPSQSQTTDRRLSSARPATNRRKKRARRPGGIVNTNAGRNNKYRSEWECAAEKGGKQGA